MSSAYNARKGRCGMGSIPRGVGAPPPPGTHSATGKLVCIKVRLLDDTIAVFHLGHRALGVTLMDEVARHLNLLERDYFGLVFVDSNGLQCWLEMDKPILRQITNMRSDAKFYMIVKFYTPNPVDLEEEYTRYLFTLQIRRDLSTGELACSETTAALLVAYIVQSDCGDFSEDDYPDATYLSHSRFIPHQTMEFQLLVRKNHSRLIGMSPGESDLALLEVARRCEFYGIKLHPAKDIEGSRASLASFHGGIKVYHQMQCVSTFSWAKVRKLSFKRRRLLVKLHPDASQFYKETIEFTFETRNECKSFWKKCVEQHAFFRCVSTDLPRKEGRLFSSGSSFRYRGRTHKELMDYVREHHKRREPFTRPLRSATTRSCNPYSTYISGYVSDPGTARSLPAAGGVALDARVSRKHRSTRTVSVTSPLDKASSDVGSYGNKSVVGVTTSSHPHSSFHPPPSSLSRTNHIPQSENMSLSLPNVLDECQVESEAPPKSASGESFFENTKQSIEFDTISHDSYRLSEHEGLHAEKKEKKTILTTFGDGYAVLERINKESRRDEIDLAKPSPLFSALSQTPSTSSDPPSSRPHIFTSSGAMLLKPRVIESDEEYSSVAAYAPLPPLHAPTPNTYTLPSASVESDPLPPPISSLSSRPLPGKVITKESIVITPEGVKERQKPQPPPKPTIDSGGKITDSEGVVIGRSRPALISVKSEDEPEVEKCHLFNSSIPYTLTLRKLSSESPKDKFATNSLGRDSRGTDMAGRRKSLDLVPRKRLPSPASYSSQDHTIVSTTPDQGDILEYILHRRSLSNDRSQVKNKRRDARRQTQPVRFNLPPSSSSPPSPFTGSAPFLLQDEDETVSEGRSLHEGMEKLEGATLSLASFSSDKVIDEEEPLPPPPSIKKEKKTPPPPPPKPVTNVVNIRTMLMEREITFKTDEGKRRSTELKHVPPPTVPKTEGKAEREKEEKTEGESPPFIDESPPSSKKQESKEDTPPSTRTTKDGLQWTDF